MPDKAIEHGLELIEAGADVLDIGGESTRPGAEAVSADEELRRIVPVVEGLAGTVPISIDTAKADGRGRRDRPRRLDRQRRHRTPWRRRHGRALRRTRGGGGADAHARHTADDAERPDLRGRRRRSPGLPARTDRARGGGGHRPREDLDRSRHRFRQDARRTTSHCLRPRTSSRRPGCRSWSDLPAKLSSERSTGRPRIDRLGGTIAACLEAMAGGAGMVRVHDVGPVAQAIRVAQSIADGQ